MIRLDVDIFVLHLQVRMISSEDFQSFSVRPMLPSEYVTESHRENGQSRQSVRCCSIT